MKKELKTIISLLLLGAFLFPVCPNGQKTMDDTKCPIDLEQEHKPSRSGTATVVTAYISSDVITVETENYAGNTILVEIFDARGILQLDAHFDCTDYVVVDISSLPPGKYEIAVTLDYRYKGRFER